ncbi:unnamed protein product [Heligmosomoides polygyrus]|uniref:Reverse transcriptase domain-containing protein n=1 Tax=Heligmosomoides polygyrus TaxID=6339 RepID=A0A183FD34_HELPZ|nr:unnamed protein product [Heligmosomoides polygyrus]
MKLGKAARPDGVPVEAWKVLVNLGINWLTQFLNRITKEGKMSDDWSNSTIVPIFKQKGDASECSNYRGIKLISHTMKIYERLVDSRLREMVPISQVQWGFMPERSTTDAIFIARQTPGKRPRGAPRKRWKDVIKRDLAEVGATADDALDRMRWRQITRTADPATARG